MVEPGHTVNVPFRAETLRLDVSWAAETVGTLELTCCAIGGTGAVRDSVGTGRCQTADASTRHEEGPQGESVSIQPAKIDPRVEALLFFVSAVDSDAEPSDLFIPKQLSLQVATSEVDGALQPLVQGDLKRYVSAPLFMEEGQLGNGNNTLAICALHRTSAGWQLTFLLEAFSKSSWVQLLPEVRELLCGLSQFPVDKMDPSSQGFTPSPRWRRGEDRALKDIVNREILQIDFGWEVIGPEDPEGVDLGFGVTFFDIKGTEVQSVGTANKAAQGVQAVEAAEEAASEDMDSDDAPKPKSPAQLPLETFPLKDSIVLNMAELPQEACSALLYVTNFGGTGFKHVQSVGCRLKPCSEDGTPSPDLLSVGSFTALSRGDSLETTSAVLLCKLYKESKLSAFAQWQSGRSEGDLAALLGDDTSVRTLFMTLKHEQAVAAARTAKLSAAAEAGEEPPQDLQQEEKSHWTWRLRCEGTFSAALSNEELQAELARQSNYIGRFNSEGKRHDNHAKATLENGDTFFGGYSQDKRRSDGLYVFACGGAYAGTYSDSKREGMGMMLMPDGGVYHGSFVGDAFSGEGQYEYPDGNTYVGGWKRGKKHGKGTLWEANEKGCTRGEWEGGILNSSTVYERPGYHFQGSFSRGVPSGACTFSITGLAATSQRALASAHLLDIGRPTLTNTGCYQGPTQDNAPEEEDAGEQEPGDFPTAAPIDYSGLQYIPSQELPRCTLEPLFRGKDIHVV